jgi:hypothetical protein
MVCSCLSLHFPVQPTPAFLPSCCLLLPVPCPQSFLPAPTPPPPPPVRARCLISNQALLCVYVYVCVCNFTTTNTHTYRHTSFITLSRTLLLLFHSSACLPFSLHFGLSSAAPRFWLFPSGTRLPAFPFPAPLSPLYPTTKPPKPPLPPTSLLCVITCNFNHSSSSSRRNSRLTNFLLKRKQKKNTPVCQN